MYNLLFKILVYSLMMATLNQQKHGAVIYK